jgi:hypothetical protein
MSAPDGPPAPSVPAAPLAPSAPSAPLPPSARTGDARLLCLVFLALAVLAAARLVCGSEDPPPPLPIAPHRVNLATASVAELGALPGVGPKLAQRIDDERRRRPFAAAADLRRVPGIGPTLIGRIAPHATVGGNGEPDH